MFHIPSFLEELKQLDAFSAKNEDKRIDYSGRILLSNRCHIVFDFHRIVDGLRESRAQGTKEFIGTTKQGIGPSYSTKMARTSLRSTLLSFHPYFEIQWVTYCTSTLFPHVSRDLSMMPKWRMATSSMMWPLKLRGIAAMLSY